MIKAKEAKEIAIHQNTTMREIVKASQLYENINQKIKEEALLGGFRTNIKIKEEDLKELGHPPLVLEGLSTLLKNNGYWECDSWVWRGGVYGFFVAWDDIYSSLRREDNNVQLP